MVMNNKRGWIRIVEAVIAVLLIAGVLIFVISKGYIGGQDFASDVYDFQISVLREIELNSDLRGDILGVDIEEGGAYVFPPRVTDLINSRTPSYLSCQAKICNMTDVCFLDSFSGEEEVYAESVGITAEGNEFKPRQLKLFCRKV